MNRLLYYTFGSLALALFALVALPAIVLSFMAEGAVWIERLAYTQYVRALVLISDTFQF